MKKTITVLVLGLALAGLLSTVAFAAGSTSATVNYEVAPINEISLSGTVSLAINEAVAGENPKPASDDTTTYAITTNGTNKKITAQIEEAMPAGLTLSISLANPTGEGVSDNVELSMVAADVITGISNVSSSGRTVTYTLNATAEAAVTADQAANVTLTIADGV